jgi:hypothetical protein
MIHCGSIHRGLIHRMVDSSQDLFIVGTIHRRIFLRKVDLSWVYSMQVYSSQGLFIVGLIHSRIESLRVKLSWIDSTQNAESFQQNTWFQRKIFGLDIKTRHESTRYVSTLRRTDLLLIMLYWIILDSRISKNKFINLL